MFIGLYGGMNSYLFSNEAFSMYNMHIFQFTYSGTSQTNINLFLDSVQALAAKNIKVILDIGDFHFDTNISYQQIDNIFNMLEPYQNSIYAVTLSEENPVEKASTLNDFYTYIKAKWPWVKVYQWFGAYPGLSYYSISNVGTDGYVINPYSLTNPAFTNFLLPFFDSGKPLICLPYAAIQPDFPTPDTLSDQIPILHGLQIPSIFYAFLEWHNSSNPTSYIWKLLPIAAENPDAETQAYLTANNMTATVAAKWQQMKDAITMLNTAPTMSVQDFRATLHISSRSAAARTIGPLGIPLALLHQLWLLRERFISKEVHKKLHPLV